MIKNVDKGKLERLAAETDAAIEDIRDFTVRKRRRIECAEIHKKELELLKRR